MKYFKEFMTGFVKGAAIVSGVLAAQKLVDFAEARWYIQRRKNR